MEEDAGQAKRGLWSDQNPVPPWEVRQPKQGRTPLARGDLSSEPMENPDTTPMPIIGNRNSHWEMMVINRWDVLEPRGRHSPVG
ncbi:MAG: hypothetical protein ABI955_13670 [Nitrospirota bacterium]